MITTTFRDLHFKIDKIDRQFNNQYIAARRLNCVFTYDRTDKMYLKTKYSKYKSKKKNDKRTKNLRIYIIYAGSNNKTVPKTICLAFRYDEASVAPQGIT